MKQSRLLQTAVPSILATRHEFPFGGTSTKASAFLIQRASGTNILVYSSSHVGEYVDHIAELGGVTHQLLNHRDEASTYSNVLSAPVFCHALEKEAIEEKGAIVGETYQGTEYKFGEDLIAYHTPGHSRGVTTYYYQNDKDISVLFTGDTLYANAEGRLLHGPLQFHSYPGKAEDFINTLTMYIDMNPTYIISGLTESEFCTKFDAKQVQEQIDELKKKRSSQSSLV
jgi:glyoxylase-like metal-dependent hydrolase (beta-lactamase superfamily II)